MWWFRLLLTISLVATLYATCVAEACPLEDVISFDGFTSVSLLQSSLEVVPSTAHVVKNITLLHEPEEIFRHSPQGHPLHEDEHDLREQEHEDHEHEHELHATPPFLYAVCFVIPVWFGSFLCWKSCLGRNAEHLLEEAGIVTQTPQEPPKRKRRASILTDKMHHHVEHDTEWQKKLGRFLESPWISSLIIVMVLVDLLCVVIDDVLEETDLLNPKYHAQGEIVAHTAHNIILVVLMMFMTEHVCALIAFGMEVFHHVLFVLDVCVVWINFMADVVFGDIVGDAVGWLIVLRLWKLVALAVDIAELLERASGHAHDAHGHHEDHHSHHHGRQRKHEHQEEMERQHSN